MLHIQTIMNTLQFIDTDSIHICNQFITVILKKLGTYSIQMSMTFTFIIYLILAYFLMKIETQTQKSTHFDSLFHKYE